MFYEIVRQYENIWEKNIYIQFFVEINKYAVMLDSSHN